MLRVRDALSGWDGGRGLMTFYFTTALQNADAASRVAGAVRTLLFSPISSSWPTGVSAQVSGDVDILDASSGDVTGTLSVAAPAVVPGVGGSSKAPSAVAALVTLTTSVFLGGRRVRGRIYVSPLAGTAVASDGLLASTHQADLAGLLAFISGSLDEGDSWVVWHRPASGVGGSACGITATN